MILCMLYCVYVEYMCMCEWGQMLWHLCHGAYVKVTGQPWMSVLTLYLVWDRKHTVQTWLTVLWTSKESVSAFSLSLIEHRDYRCICYSGFYMGSRNLLGFMASPLLSHLFRPVLLFYVAGMECRTLNVLGECSYWATPLTISCP